MPGDPEKLPSPDADGDLFELISLYPRDIWLPMTIWVSPRGHALHDVRVKACMTPGDRMDADNTLSSAEMAQVTKWIGLNVESLIGYWDGELSTVEFVRAMQRV